VGIPRRADFSPEGSQDLRPWRTLALLGATFACIATLVLAALPAPIAPSTTPSTRPLPSRHALPTHLTARLPVSLAPAASAKIGASEHSFWPVRRGGSVLTTGGGIHTTFTASGAGLHVAQGTLGISLTGVGRGQHLKHVAAVAPKRAASQVLYRTGSISEFYRNGPYGLEQGFTLRKRPQTDTGSLVLALGLGGSLVPEQVGSQIRFRTHAGVSALRYGQLSALDATGRQLPALIQIHNRTLQLRIDDRGARYPLRIDPLIQQSKLASGQSGSGQFGESVALSSDGNTALIGGNWDASAASGAAWVFTRSSGIWTQQGPALNAGLESGGPAGNGFGRSVALSADGNTALIGAPGHESGRGAAWVFTRSGSTWTQQGSPLGGASGGNVGSSVALSSDGNTALIGGANDNSGTGAAWVFARSSGIWTQQGSKLTGTSESGAGKFGSSVALSADGSTALIGGGGDASNLGAAWVFTRSGSTWTQQGAKLTGGGEGGEGVFGHSVALSADGNTAQIGGPSDGGATGAAWVFTRTSGVWSQQGEKLTASGASGQSQFGSSVALSSDGNTTLIGGPRDHVIDGAAWKFTRSSGIWTQQGSKLTPNDGAAPEFGTSVALSSNATTALIGGPLDNLGAAWAFIYATAPGAPTGVSAVPGSRQAIVSFTAPSANGSPITSYTVTASPGGAQASGTSSPITVTGLSDWTAYTFTVTATNAAGTSPTSSPSTAITTRAQSTIALLPSIDPSVYGAPLTFNATVLSEPVLGPPTPTGTVNFTVTGEASVPVTLNGGGQANFDPGYYLNVGEAVTASYGGDANHGPSSAELKPTIYPAQTATSLTASANPATRGSAVTLIAAVKNMSTTIVPFGLIQFVVDGEPVLDPLPLDENGEAGIVSEGALHPGDHVVQAFYFNFVRLYADFTASNASLTEHITIPPPPAAPPAKGVLSVRSAAPPPPPFQAMLSAFPLGPTVRGLLRGGFSDSVVLNGPGSVTQDLFSDNGALPATASRAAAAYHKKSKRRRAALLLAKGSASTATAGTVNVTLLPTAAAKKTLKKTRHSLRVVLITTVTDAKTGKATKLAPHTLTLKR
jgi:hypothetical protein